MRLQRRLLICSPSHALYGGVETIVNDLCVLLPARGWEVVLGLAKGVRYNDPERYRAAHPGLRSVELDGTSGTREGRAAAVASTIADVAPDVVLSARLFDVYEAMRLLRREARRPRFAVAVRAFEPPYLYDARLYRDVIDLCVADGALVTAAAVRWAGIPAARVANIPGGILAPVKPRSQRAPGGPLRIGYVGRLANADKRVLDLEELLAQLDRNRVRYRLNVVGAGPDEQELRTRLSRRESEGTVRFTGWLTREELFGSVYPQLDCILNFSPSEGMTISPREAMAHGVVPVLSAFRGITVDALFRNGENCLTFAVGDLETAARHLKRLADDQAFFDRLSAAGAAPGAAEHTLAGSMDAWAAALEGCCAMAPAPGPFPQIAWPPSGRLARWGVSPRLAQRLRALGGVAAVAGGPGDEWPHCSGLMPDACAAALAHFARACEVQRDGG